MTRDDLMQALPLIREALVMANDGDISGSKSEIVLTIRLDVAALFAKAEFSALRLRTRTDDGTDVK